MSAIWSWMPRLSETDYDDGDDDADDDDNDDD